MARVGSFSGPTDVFAQPLNVVHPADNDIAKSRYHALLFDPRIEAKMRDELMQQILDLLALLKVGRDELGY